MGARGRTAASARVALVSLVALGVVECSEVAADFPGAIVFDADVTDQAALDAAVAGTVEAFGGIDTVIANAGIAAPGCVARWTRPSFERIIEVNLARRLAHVRACLPHVIERRGYVLPVASVAAICRCRDVGLRDGEVRSRRSATRCASRCRATASRSASRTSRGSNGDVRGTDRTELGATMRGMLKGPLAKSYPVSAAARGRRRGIENRSRIVACPRWLRC